MVIFFFEKQTIRFARMRAFLLSPSFSLSSPRKRESRRKVDRWIPASAGMTKEGWE